MSHRFGNNARVNLTIICHCGPRVSCRIPVSYTHLDVYKRQVCTRATGGLSGPSTRLPKTVRSLAAIVLSLIHIEMCIRDSLDAANAKTEAIKAAQDEVAKVKAQLESTIDSKFDAAKKELRCV